MRKQKKEKERGKRRRRKKVEHLKELILMLLFFWPRAYGAGPKKFGSGNFRHAKNFFPPSSKKMALSVSL